jgi:sugar lactone lactonase YvrE
MVLGRDNGQRGTRRRIQRQRCEVHTRAADSCCPQSAGDARRPRTPARPMRQAALRHQTTVGGLALLVFALGLLLAAGCGTRRASESPSPSARPKPEVGRVADPAPQSRREKAERDRSRRERIWGGWVPDYEDGEVPPGCVVAGFAGSVDLCPLSSDGPADSADFCFPVSIAESPAGDVYVAEPFNGAVRVISEREVHTLQARHHSTGPVAFDRPVGVWFRGDTLFICDIANGTARIWQIDPNTSEASLMPLRWADGEGSGDEPVLTHYAYSPSPMPDGGFLVADGRSLVGHGREAEVRRVSPTGEVSRWAALPGKRLGSNMGLFAPDVAVVWVGKGRAAVTHRGITHLTAQGPRAEVLPVPRWFTPLAWDSRRERLLGADDSAVLAVTLDGQVTTIAGGEARGHADGTGPAASFNAPMGLCVAPNGDVLVADTENNLIRRITPDGVVTTIAGTGKRCLVPLYAPL